MPNAKQTLSTLLLSLDSAFKTLPEHTHEQFKRSYTGALDLSTTYNTQIYGHQSTTILNCLRSSLQATASASRNPEVYNAVWNPIVASLFSVLEKVIIDLSSPDTGSSQEGKIQVNPTKTSGLQKESIIEKPRPLQKEKPLKVKATPSKPVVARIERCPTDIEAQIRARYAKTQGPIFTNLPFVKCVDPQCVFCIKLRQSLDLTKCSLVRCHKSGSVCQDGWSAHVFPTMWSAVKDDHEFGIPFRGIDYYVKKIRSGEKKSTPSVVKSVSFSEALKRKAAPTTMDVDDVSAKRISSDVSATSNPNHPLNVDPDEIWKTTDQDAFNRYEDSYEASLSSGELLD